MTRGYDIACTVNLLIGYLHNLKLLLIILNLKDGRSTVGEKTSESINEDMKRYWERCGNGCSVWKRLWWWLLLSTALITYTNDAAATFRYRARRRRGSKVCQPCAAWRLQRSQQGTGRFGAVPKRYKKCLHIKTGEILLTHLPTQTLELVTAKKPQKVNTTKRQTLANIMTWGCMGKWQDYLQYIVRLVVGP